MSFESEGQRCITAAIKYAAYRIKTEGQIRDYLCRKGFEAEDIERAVDALKDYGYIDDARYCRSYYIESCRKGRGRLRIEKELIGKKLPASFVRETLKEFLDECNSDADGMETDIVPERERALAVVEKAVSLQLEEGKPIDRKFAAKVGRRLTSLGYDSSTVYEAVGMLMKNRD